METEKRSCSAAGIARAGPPLHAVQSDVRRRLTGGSARSRKTWLSGADATVETDLGGDTRNRPRARLEYRTEQLYKSLRQEGAFAIATMWLAMHFIRLGKVNFAVEYIDAIIGSANHLGLFAEEFDPRNGDFLGNFPQLFVHAALIDAIHNVDDLIKGARNVS